MSASNDNPYAAPRTGNQSASESSSIGPDRASEEMLHKAMKLMLISELAYICSWLMAILDSVSDFAKFDLTEVLLLVALILLATAWFSILTLMITIRSRMWWICLAVPFPCLGVIPFLACINEARRFLLRNGYRPGVWGSSPEEEEIAAMAADPNYVPSVFLNRDGTIRSLPYPLTLTAGAITLLAVITFTIITAAVLT